MAVRGRLARWLTPLCLLGALCPALVQAGGVGRGADVPPALDNAQAWLVRIQQAATTRNYQGTMVFTAGGVTSSSRVAHFCVGDQVYERIEALDGKQRQVYRHNEEVHTVWPQDGLVVVERRSLQASLPSAMQSLEPRALEQYELRPEGNARMAGREARVFLLQPRDDMRFAQRIWVDFETGLMLGFKVIDVGAGQAVLESTVFSDVEIGVTPRPASVLQPLRRLSGLRVQRPLQQPTQLEAQGWTLARPLAGFQLTSCTQRLPADAVESSSARPGLVQAVFSDGLTHVSMFIESFDARRHRKEIQTQFGATHSLTRRNGEHWITVMGDVPATTLRRFADALERRP